MQAIGKLIVRHGCMEQKLLVIRAAIMQQCRKYRVQIVPPNSALQRCVDLAFSMMVPYCK